MIKFKKLLWLFFLSLFFLNVYGQEAPYTFRNPVLPGFNPDPSVCRVGDDYYLVTSSFVCYPGLPVYHSKDLVNWELISYALNRPDWIDFSGINDNDGIWAPTLRYHDGKFYLITTAYHCGGNFYITATDPHGPWSDPVWLKEAPGIDPSLFWDDDGRCYYTGNRWDLKNNWPAQCSVWTQELDLKEGRLTGPMTILSTGHAYNAQYAEGPHLYKINGQYLLLMSEGGSGRNHALTVHHSKSVMGPYVAGLVNPVLTTRHMGSEYCYQNFGHADLVQTQNGEWWAVFLGNRNIDGFFPLARETFLCKVKFDGQTPIFNPGKGSDVSELQRPDLPWTPVAPTHPRDEFDADSLDMKWHFVRIPSTRFYQLKKGRLALSLRPQVIDSLTNAAMIVRRVEQPDYVAMTRLEFKAKKENESAGLVLYRTANGYYSLLRTKAGIRLVKKHLGKKEIVAEMPYDQKAVCLKITVRGMEAVFSFGETPDTLTTIGGGQSLVPVADNKFNKFNGTCVGMYATSNGDVSGNQALYDWFELLY